MIYHCFEMFPAVFCLGELWGGSVLPQYLWERGQSCDQEQCTQVPSNGRSIIYSGLRLNWLKEYCLVFVYRFAFF